MFFYLRKQTLFLVINNLYVCQIIVWSAVCTFRNVPVISSVFLVTENENAFFLDTSMYNISC